MHGRFNNSGLRRGARIAAVAGVLTLFSAVALLAHDFWVVPNALVVAAGGTIEMRGQSGTKFPTSTSAVAPERVAEARVVGASEDERISDLSVKDSSLILRHKPTTPGQHIVAVALVARSSRTTPTNLKRYIALEVVPVNDPSALRAGHSLAVRLVFRSQPVVGAHLHAGAAAPPNAAQDAGEQAKDLSVVTGADGVAKIPLDRAGLWNVRTLHAAPAAGASTEWEVAFATLVFSVGTPNGSADARIESHGDVARPTNDSADVAAAVAAYHSALATGDSVAALALLAPDAIIVESGGIETREEYRSHHLAGDIAFARGIKSERGPVRVVMQGDIAWATSTSTTQGEYRGRQINSSSAELMVLSRTSPGWKIRAIHWSSRARRQ